MKKLLSVLLICMLICSLSACGASSSVSSGGLSDSSSKESASAPEESSTGIPSQDVQSSSQVEDSNFSKFESGLTELGVQYEEPVLMAAELIGGKVGYKYETTDYSIELYEFDVESEAYQKVVSDGIITIEGFGGFPAIYNQEMVMVEDSSIPQEVIDLFNSL